MMTTHFIEEVPFKKILIHGLIRDSEGQKMSKSKGNTIDPLDIIDGIGLEDLIKKRTEGLMQPKMKSRIEKQTRKEFPEGIKPYGTDALRLTFCSLASGGRDINFDLKRVEGYRNFCNKLWNAARFIHLNAEAYGVSESKIDTNIDRWIQYKLNETTKDVKKYFEEYRFDLLTKTSYEFIWYEFCDWYIELNKVRLSEPNAKKPEIVKSMIDTLEQTLKLVHPLMPFVTEEIWKQFKIYFNQKDESLMLCSFPKINSFETDKSYIAVEWLKRVVSGIRNIRGELVIKPAQKIPAIFKEGTSEDRTISSEFDSFIKELASLESIQWEESDKESPPSSIFVLNKLKILIPLEGLIDPKKESLRLQKKLEKLDKEKTIIASKLNNKSFVDNAPNELVRNQEQRFQELSGEIDNLNREMKEIEKLI